MYGGEVVETGLCGDVIGRPQHPYTEGLMRSIPVPGRVARRQRLGYVPGVVPRPVGVLSACGFLARCPYAETECGAAPVAMRGIAAGQGVRCLKSLGEGSHDPGVWERIGVTETAV